MIVPAKRIDCYCDVVRLWWLGNSPSVHHQLGPRPHTLSLAYGTIQEEHGPLVAAIQIGMKTYDINEAADFLKIDRSTALELASAGTLPGAKVGRAWVFMEDELIAYLRDVTRKQTQSRRAHAEASQVIDRVVREPTPRRGTRRRPLPALPELSSQIAAA